MNWRNCLTLTWPTKQAKNNTSHCASRDQVRHTWIWGTEQRLDRAIWMTLFGHCHAVVFCWFWLLSTLYLLIAVVAMCTSQQQRKSTVSGNYPNPVAGNIVVCVACQESTRCFCFGTTYFNPKTSKIPCKKFNCWRSKTLKFSPLKSTFAPPLAPWWCKKATASRPAMVLHQTTSPGLQSSPKLQHR